MDILEKKGHQWCSQYHGKGEEMMEEKVHKMHIHRSGKEIMKGRVYHRHG